MSLNPNNSFSAKIFIFSTFLVLLSIVAIGYDYIKDVQNLLRDEYMSRSLDSAEKYGLEISGMIQGIESQLISFSQLAASKNQSEIKSRLKAIDKSYPSFKGIYTIEQKGKAFKRLETFEEPKVSYNKITKFLHSSTSGASYDLRIHSFNNKNMILARRFAVEKNKSNYWVVAVFGVNLIERLYSLDNDQTTHILDKNQVDIYSGELYKAMFSRKGYANKVIRSIKSDSGAGFISNVIEKNKKKVNVTFFQLPQYDLSIVFHKRTANLIDSIMETLIKVGLKISLVFLISIMAAYLLTRSITSKLEQVFDATVKIASGDFEHQIPIRSHDEIGLLAYSVNRMSGMIRDLLLSQKEKFLLEKELETAQMVQNTFFQNTTVDTGQFRISSYYVPASQCGGDWWGHFDLGPGIKLIVIGDATGHGVPAALITAIAYTTANTFADEITRSKVMKPPSLLLSQLNKVLNATLDGKLCMTFYAMIFDANKQTVTFSNGGHVFPLLLPVDGSDERLTSPRSKKMKIPIKIISENKGSSILGIEDKTVFDDAEIQIKPGDRFILYTDGITEAVNNKGKMMGNRGFIKMLQNINSKNIQVITDHVIEKTVDFNHSGDVFEDDVTLVVVEFSSAQGVNAA